MRLVLASNNASKIKELSALLAVKNYELINQSQLGIPEVPETGLSFVENALIKARHAATLSKLPALADDSGLVVAALNGAPGIHSARYAGEPSNDKNNIAKLLTALKEVPEEKRSAYFYCVIVLLSHPHDPTPIICEGIWHGKILSAARGNGGFGYDPIFFIPEHKLSAAELPKDLKNTISHRAQALQKLIKKI